VFVRIGGKLEVGEGCIGAAERHRAEYRARYPSGDALSEFQGAS
jgi:hypothetical protein